MSDIANGTKDNQNETLAFEIYKEQREQNRRLEENNKRLTKNNLILGLAIPVCILLTAGMFLLYLYQYDFSEVTEQTGIYTYNDSNGNVISSDLSVEEMESILEVINNGNTENNKGQDESK